MPPPTPVRARPVPDHQRGRPYRTRSLTGGCLATYPPPKSSKVTRCLRLVNLHLYELAQCQTTKEEDLTAPEVDRLLLCLGDAARVDGGRGVDGVGEDEALVDQVTVLVRNLETKKEKRFSSWGWAGPKKPTRVAAPSPRASLGRRTVCGRTERRRPPVSKRYETKVRMVWGSFLITAAALKTPTRNGYNAQGVNLTFRQTGPAHLSH